MLTLEATLSLSHEGIKVRLINMPSQELFEEQDPAYKEKILPPKAWGVGSG